MRKGFIYCRISRDPLHNELGVARQEADCRALCDKHDVTVAEVFVDDDRSAYTGKPRPGYVQLLAAIQANPRSTLVAWHPDRLTRHPRELEDLIDLLESSKATVLTVQSGEYDLSTASGRMTARVVGAVARHESEHKSARLRRKHLQLAEAGQIAGGGSRPFGYQPDRTTIIESEAIVIRELVDRLLSGATLRSLATGLNAAGVKASGGGLWTPAQMRQMLRSAHIAGLRSHLGTVVADGVWPAIITPDQHRLIRAIVDDPSRRVNARPTKYLLTRLLRCGLCDAFLVARPRQDKQRSYVCASGAGFHGCGKIRIMAEPVEALVAAGLFEAIDEDQIQPDPPQQDVAGLAEIEERMSELGEMWAAGDIDRVGWTAARKQLQKQYETIAATVTNEVRDRSLAEALKGGDLAGRWDAMPFDQKRVVLLGSIVDIKVNPAVKGRNSFDKTRVKIRWR